MRLDDDTCRARLGGADHGILATLHPTRGIDVVPACFVLLGDHLCIPVDDVKPKSSTRLQREHNLAHDPRATFLVEHWDAEHWERLWWVRTHLRRVDADPQLIARATDALRAKHAPYRDATFADLLTFEVLGLTGWAAAH